MKQTLQSVFDLSDAEKLQLVQDLWDDLASRPDTLPLQDWHLEELERRNEEYERNPGAAVPWEEVKHSVRAKHGR